MGLKVYTPEASLTAVDYTSSFVTATPTERCSVFFPTGHVPGVTTPAVCLIYFENSGFNSGSLVSEVGPSTPLLYDPLDGGAVLISATTCQTKDVSAGGPPGAGTFDPPLVSAGWDDPTQPNFAKSAIHLVQWIKENASTLGIDPDKIYATGRSGGSAPALWVALGVDWADPSISDPGQFRPGISSRIAGAMVFQTHSWWRAHDQDGVPQQYAPDSTDAANKVALYGENTFNAYQIRVSPLHYALNESSYPGVQALNASAKLFLYSPGPVFNGIGTPTDDDFAFDANDQPTLFDRITAFHDGWHPIMLHRRLSQLDPVHWEKHCRCVFRESSAGGYGETHTVNSDADAYRMMVEWMFASASNEPQPPAQEMILREVVSRLTGIVRGEDYYHTPAGVRRGIKFLLEGPYPAITVVPIGVEALQVGEELVDAITYRMRITIAFMHNSPEFADQWVLETESDIKKALHADQQLGGLVIDTQHVSTDYLYAEDPSSGLAGAEMEWEIHFRTPVTDYTYTL